MFCSLSTSSAISVISELSSRRYFRESSSRRRYSPAQRTALYTKAEQQLDKDSAIVPVYYYVNARLVKPWVGGYTGKDPLDNTYTRNMYIVKH